MTDLLERTPHAPPPHDFGPTPPTEIPPEVEATPAPWPRRAKLLVSILAVATLFGVVGTIVGATTGNGGDATDQDQIDALVEERNGLLVEQQALNDQIATQTALADELAADITQRDDRIAVLEGRMAELDGNLAGLTVEIAGLRSERDALAMELADLRTQLAAATDAVAVLENQLAATVDENAALDERITALGGDVAVLLDRVATAETERDALAGMFPMTVSTRLNPADVVGTWDLTWVRQYCEGFDTCVATPGFTRIRITSVGNDSLRVEIPGHFTAGLGRADGALTAVGQSTSALPACSGSERLANVSLTVYATSLTAKADGSQTVSHLGATVVADAPPTFYCPGGVQVFGATMTPG